MKKQKQLLPNLKVPRLQLEFNSQNSHFKKPEFLNNKKLKLELNTNHMLIELLLFSLKTLSFQTVYLTFQWVKTEY